MLRHPLQSIHTFRILYFHFEFFELVGLEFFYTLN